MKLKNILNTLDYEIVCGSTEIDINQLVDNSKIVSKDGLFVALVGGNFNGHNFVEQAIINGAKAIIVQEDIKIINDSLTIIKVKDTRFALSIIAKNYYYDKCDMSGIKFIGVTGTNGKTTSTYMLKSIFNKSGYDVGVIGTSGIFFNDEQLRGEDLTTPDPIELFEYIYKFAVMGVDYIVMEVSAHALYFEKTCGIYFDYAIFTNLTEDHLDFFRSMEIYGNAKAKLFNKQSSKYSIININDDFGAKIFKYANNFSYSFGTNGNYKLLKTNKKFDRFIIEINGHKNKYKLNMAGIYNIYNALGVISVCKLENIKERYIYLGLKDLPSIAGRYNEYDMGEHGKVVLDFAHTPDGLEKVLKRARLDLKKTGKLISVFGCGGNRDEKKRPIMGMVAGENADYVIISIDNPRNEDANKVMTEVAEGVKRVTNNYEICMPRSFALKKAVSMCTKNDIVVISGKGVEPYYDECNVKSFYREDREIVKLQKFYGIKRNV